MFAELPQTIRPDDYALRLGVSVEKVRGWIESGELPAINVATSANGKKPRWRIPPEAIDAFEELRSSTPMEGAGS